MNSHHIQPRQELGANCLTLAPGEELSLTLYVFDYAAVDERGIHQVLRWIYEKFHQSPRRICSIRQTVTDMAEAICRDAWLSEKHCYAGFVFDRTEGFEYRHLTSFSWTNGLAATLPILQAAYRLGREDMCGQALECIQHIAEGSLNPRNSLSYMCETEAGWNNHGWWVD